jgi:hypothetical protein
MIDVMMRRTLDFGSPLPNGWRLLTANEDRTYWAAFTDKFGELRPGINPESWPAIVEPVPSVTFDLDVGGRAQAWATQMDAVNAEALRCFVTEFTDDPDWIVLNWKHSGYSLDVGVHALTPDTEWRVPVHPDGDYYFFARPDFSEGTFGHPWERTLCVFGPRLVASLGQTLATWLRVKRRDGNPPRSL